VSHGGKVEVRGWNQVLCAGMRVIGGWVVVILMVIGIGIGIVSAGARPDGTVACDSPYACVALAASSSPARRLAVPVVPGGSFHQGAVFAGGPTVLLGDHETGGWSLQMGYLGPDGQRSLWFSADAASQRYASLAPWRSCRPSSGRVRCLLISGIPAYLLVSPTYVWLSGLHDGVFFLLQTPRPASLPAGDLGPSPTRSWLVGIMASAYGS
jgi:hypothetical protein